MMKFLEKKQEQNKGPSPSLAGHALATTATPPPICFLLGAIDHIEAGPYHEIDHSKLPPRTTPEQLKAVTPSATNYQRISSSPSPAVSGEVMNRTVVSKQGPCWWELKSTEMLTWGTRRQGRCLRRHESSPSSRWSPRRYEAAEANMLGVMKGMDAKSGSRILRPALRSKARKLIKDTGLLDHLLKHMVDKVAPGGTERFRRGHNADGAMEYWLESADLFDIRKQAGVQDPYWIPPPGWEPGDNPTRDPICIKEIHELKEEIRELKEEITKIKRRTINPVNVIHL